MLFNKFRSAVVAVIDSVTSVSDLLVRFTFISNAL